MGRSSKSSWMVSEPNNLRIVLIKAYTKKWWLMKKNELDISSIFTLIPVEFSLPG